MEEGRCIWSLALVQYLLSIKVPTGFTAALVPPHVLTEVLLSDHTAVHCPLVPHAFVGQSSWRGAGERQEVNVQKPKYSYSESSNIFLIQVYQVATDESSLSKLKYTKSSRGAQWDKRV